MLVAFDAWATAAALGADALLTQFAPPGFVELLARHVERIDSCAIGSDGAQA